MWKQAAHLGVRIQFSAPSWVSGPSVRLSSSGGTEGRRASGQAPPGVGAEGCLCPLGAAGQPYSAGITPVSWEVLLFPTAKE